MNDRRSPAGCLRSEGRPEAAGFTLIELLVVVAIIAILAGMLLPALSKAREAGRAAACRGNEKSLVLAWMLYHEDSNGKIVRAHDQGRANFDWVGPKQTAAGVVTGSGGTVAEEIQGLQDGMLWPYLRSAGVYHCLSDLRDWKMQGKKINQGRAYRSYSMPCGMNGGYSPNPITLANQIVSPAAKYVLVEEEVDVGGVNWGAWLLPCPFTDSWWDPIAIRHGNKNCLAFADGHVELHKWLDPRTFQMSDGRLQGVSAPGSPDLKYMQQGYAQVGDQF